MRPSSGTLFDTDNLRAILEAQAAAQQALIQQLHAPVQQPPPRALTSTPVAFADATPSPQQFQSQVSLQASAAEVGGAPELDPADVVFDEKKDFVGCGVFGKVYRGLCRGQVVAVKVPLNQDEITEEQLAEFRAEVAIMRKIYHFSVVLFLGACTQPHRIMIVTQFMAGGSLDTLLKSDTPLSFDERIGIAKDVALGLAWLHNISKIVHRDLKPANLLLNSNRRCKITDFGFAQLRQLEHKRETQPRGSVFWMSPELLTGKPFNECFPERDHELLTNRGFLSLERIIERVDYDARSGAVRDWRGLQFAGFDTRRRELVYETPHALVVNDTVAHTCTRLIRFVGDDDGVSVVVTANHNMFVQCAQQPFVKMPASRVETLVQRKAIALRFCALDAAGRWSTPLVTRVESPSMYEHERTWCVRMPSGFVVTRHVLARDAVGGVLDASLPTVQGNSVDVFSYGIILWQILTRRPLYDNQYSEIAPFVQAVCVRGERPHIRDDDCSPQLAVLMRQCWAAEPAKRCTADHICEELDVAFVANSVTVAPGSALQQAPDAVYDDTSNAAGSAAVAATLETAAARSFWRSVAPATALPLPSACKIELFSEQFRLRLPSDRAESLVSRFVRAFCHTNETRVASSLSSSTMLDLQEPTMSIERFNLLLCCLGSWLPHHMLLERAKPPNGAALTPAYPRDMTVALDVIAWSLRLADCAWFHAFADKDVAERRLANRRERTFLVRMSSTHTDYPFTISLVRNAATAEKPDLRVQHKRIQRVWDRQHPSNCQWLVANSDGNIVAFTDFFEMIASDALRLTYPCDKDEISMPYLN